MFYQILCLFLVPLCTSIYLCRKEQKKLVAIAFLLYSSTILLNSLSYIFTNQSMFGLLDVQASYYLLYCFESIILNFLCFKLWRYLQKFSLKIFKKTTLLVVVLLTNILIYFLWLLDNSGRMSFELFYFNISNPVNTSVSGFYEKTAILLTLMMFMSLCVSFIILKSAIFTSLQLHTSYSRKQILGATTLIFGCLIASIAFPCYAFHLEDAYAYLYANDVFIKEHYIDPRSVQMTWPLQKRNLVLIFAESFESSYFAKDLGGMLDENLLPELSKLMDEGMHFSEQEGHFGGETSMPQATNTIAGMVTTLSGVNYKIPPWTKDGDLVSTVPGSINLQDVLKQQGYDLYFTLGSNLESYSIGPYYRQHGNAKTIGYEEKIASGELPADYKVWWGFEDSKLYQFAKEDLTTLGKAEQPFMYTIATNDVHNPGGYTDPTCDTPYDDPMQNAILCADKQMSELLRWMMEQPFYKNTTVVVVGDHIGHADPFIDKLQPASDRRVFNLILNDISPDKQKDKPARKFWAGDMFPTILSALGVKIDGNRLGLGANLFSNEPTLLEVYGEESMRASLEKKSEFYFEVLSQLPQEDIEEALK